MKNNWIKFFDWIRFKRNQIWIQEHAYSVVGTWGAIAVCRMGFCTCVDFTDCIMIGECVLRCHEPIWHTFVDLDIGCGDIDVEGGTGLGDPADVAE